MIDAAGYRRGVEEAANVLKELRGARRLCSEANKGHDDRWCAECSSMEDAYGYAEGQIRALGEKS